MTTFTTDHFLHGCDYNPDQWLERPGHLSRRRTPDALSRDQHRQPAYFFVGDALKPEEGVYQFDWLDEALDRVERAVA